MISNPYRNRATIIWILVGLAVVAGSFFGGMFIGRLGTVPTTSNTAPIANILGVGSSPQADALDEKDIQFSQFWELWKMLKMKYYESTSEQKMFYGAMKGMAEALGDPYTSFFEPVTAKEFSDSLKGEFDGIGAEIGIRDGQLTVIAPLPDSPAEKAGLRAGDMILQINSTSTEGMFTEEAVTYIRGKKGTTVKLKIGRMPEAKTVKGKAVQGTPEIKDYVITRDVIVVKSVRVSWPKDGYALVQITSFDEKTGKEFTEAIDKLLPKNPKGIILDLRNDPGGFLDKSTIVAGEWVGDRVVVSERRKGKIVDEFHGQGTGRLSGIPTVVLVNQGSASAAEIVTGALRDYGLATVIGMKTFGKGSVQDYSEFADGSAVKITIAEWLTPKGNSINKTGIKPDIEVDKTIADYNENRDPQLDKALLWFTDPVAASASSTQATAAAPKAP
ncbi:MAG: S41 family peptidase [Patescibacteria group bacterium]|jgi:carboxyl-terminal processing protease